MAKKYIDAEKLIAEINRKIGSIENRLKEDTTLISEAMLKGSLDTYESIERLITSLQQEQPEVDLEEAAEKYANRGISSNADPYEETIAYRADKDAFKAGAKWQKEQMMKNAVEGTVHNFSSNKPHPTVLVDAKGFNQGDKVRIIIVKNVKEEG